MKIAVVSGAVPFAHGGARAAAATLAVQATRLGHAAISMQLPFSLASDEALLDGVVAASMLRVEVADRVVALNFPAYFVRHAAKVAWLLEAADYAGRGAVAQAIANIDLRALRGVRLFAASAPVAERLSSLGDLIPVMLPVPAPDDDAAWAAVVAELVA
jgi:hypothetical protein